VLLPNVRTSVCMLLTHADECVYTPACTCKQMHTVSLALLSNGYFVVSAI
jgi:hypothetical protein